MKSVYTAVVKPKKSNIEITKRLNQTLRTYKETEATELVLESTQLLEDGLYGLSEISKLVISLKDFSRLDRKATEQVDINECIESTLTIASNNIAESNVTVDKQLGEIPKIACFPSKLNQLFLNIITNACQAMKESGGSLEVRSELTDAGIRIVVKDDGVGMDQETKQQMFDPFFTSKEIGEGTGLGMSIAYKIVEAHNGTIEVTSELNEGTEISIILPIPKD